MAKRGVIFKDAPVIKPNRSWCDDSAKHDTSCNFGELIVGHVSDHMAHDVVKLRSNSFGYMEAMLAPSFGKCDIFSYWFYVNKRHIWPDWKKFRPNNDQLKTWEQMRTFVSPTMPYITLDPLRGSSFNLPLVPYQLFTGSDNHLYYKLYDNDLVQGTATAIFKEVVSVRNGVNYISYELVTPDVKYDNPTYWKYSTDYAYIAVNYKRNLKDIQSKRGNKWYKFDSDLTSLNIFSVGDLFNYMGLSINDVQKDRAFYFAMGLQVLSADIHNIPNSVFDKFVLQQFMKQYFVVSVFYLGDNTNTVASFGFNDKEGFYYEFDNVGEKLIKVTNPAPGLLDISNRLATMAGNTGNEAAFKVWQHDLDTRINTLPIRAYEYIYDEYFRDENWIPVNTYTDFTRNGQEQYDTAEQVRYFSIRKKAWSHDPYTSALPGPQRGDAIRFLSDASVKAEVGSAPSPAFSYRGNVVAGTNAAGNFMGLGTNALNATAGNANNSLSLTVDLSAATIENFRIANVRQRYEELFARTGGRYVEWQKGVMGANISDIEDERPLYLYGSRNPIQIAQVVQTSSTNVDTDQPLGDLAGRGVYQGKGDYIEFDCPDDGILMQILCVVPQQSYQTGINPIFTRHNWLDYPIPMFAQLGEEHVKLQNIWFNGSRAEDERSFGYQSRYWDWKYSRDQVTGQLSTDLDFWTFAREFEDEPINGQDFLEVNVDYRQFAVQDRGVHHIYLSLYCDIQKNHALPVFGIPTL